MDNRYLKVPECICNFTSHVKRKRDDNLKQTMFLTMLFYYIFRRKVRYINTFQIPTNLFSVCNVTFTRSCRLRGSKV